MFDNMNLPKLPDLPDESIIEITHNLCETYNLLVNPSAEAIGGFVGDLFSLVWLPTKHVKNRISVYFDNALENFKNKLEHKVSDIPEANRTEPDLHTILCALDNARYCLTDEDLCEMFANLISNSMNSSKKGNAHPSFGEIIKQLSSTDAHIIKIFAEQESNNASLTPAKIQKEYNISKDLDVIQTSIDNIVRLGLLKTNYSLDSFSTRNIVQIAEKHDPFLKYRSNFGKVQEKSYELTAFGKKFVNVCCE